jgi:hypothetical protein
VLVVWHGSDEFCGPARYNAGFQSRSGHIPNLEGTMFRLVILLTAGLTMAAGVAAHAVAAEGESITVDLKSFKFKTTEENATLFGYDEGESKLFYYTGGVGEATVKIPADGEYELVIKASCQPALNERAKFKVALDGQEVAKETLLTADEAKEYTFPLKAKAGEHKLTIEYTNDVYKESEYDRNFYLHGVTIKKAK